MAYNTTTQTTGNLRLDRWVTKEERRLSGARRAADRFAIAEALDELDEPEPQLISYEPAEPEVEEPDCYCRRCYLHDDPAGCVV